MSLKYSAVLFVLSLFLGCKKENSPTKEIKKNLLPFAMQPATKKFDVLEKKYLFTKRAEIDGFFKKNFENEFENISFLVAKDGQIIYEKYSGFANKEKNILITANTPLHLASVSKVLTASVILKLVEAQKISLDQKLTTLFKDFPYPEITIRTLLNHRSGLVKYSNYIENSKVWNKEKILTNKDLLSILIKNKPPLTHKTNTHFVYNNTNYALLALVIEKITGLSYAKAMQEIIFEPLHMKNSYVFDYFRPQKSANPSYLKNYELFPNDYLDAIYGDKNIYSTPRDLLQFDLARNSTTFLKKELLNQLYKGYSYESKGVKNYALGLRMSEWPTGEKLFYHNGWWHGNTSAYIPLREENVVIIALSNKLTRKTYQVKRLATLFGKFPFTLNDTLSVDGIVIKSTKKESIINDSIAKK